MALALNSFAALMAVSLFIDIVCKSTSTKTQINPYCSKGKNVVLQLTQGTITRSPFFRVRFEPKNQSVGG